MATTIISERGLRKKLTQVQEAPIPKRSSKKKSPSTSKSKTQEQNNNQSKKQPKPLTGNPKLDLLSTYQPWVIQTYGDLAKTKTITLKKYSRILKTLRGEECNSTDSSKFRFWVKAKGFYLGKPPGYDAKPADGIVCRYSVLDADGCQKNSDGSDIYTGSANDPALYIPSPPVKNAAVQEPIYRKVAIVENFFDIIYTVHVELEGRPGKHAGQKRTYRTITETYAFLPREAVTRFLMGCTECQRRPRSASPTSLLPTPSPSPTLLPLNGYTALPKTIDLFKNGLDAYSTRNWESEIDASQTSPVRAISLSGKHMFEEADDNCMDLSSKHVYVGKTETLSPNSFRGVRSNGECEQINTDSTLIDVVNDNTIEDAHKLKSPAREDTKSKPYNPLDVCNLTSKDPPKSRSPPKKRHLNHLYSPNEFLDEHSPSKRWSPSVFSSPSTTIKADRFDDEIDYNVPITTTYLKRMKTLGFSNSNAMKMEFTRDNITPEPSDINDEDQYSGSIMKDAEKLKLMLLAWNYHTQSQGRNGDQVDSTAARLAAVANSDNMADLWASYHSALGLAGGKSSSAAKTQPSTPPVTAVRDQSSPILASGGASAMDTSGHDETSSSAGGTAKDDDDGMLGDDDDDSDDRVDPQHHDPERLKAFNMFVRLFVDENLDRIVPISKQPKEKIQAIIDSCTRQFPEFAERSRKRIRTYLKSCRRNKKVRGEAGGTPVSGTGSCPVGSAAWEAAMQTRPTPAHLTSIQAEQILAQACENESHNAKRMRLGLEPVSQALPTIPGNMITDTTASSATHPHPLLSLYSSTTSTNMHNPGSSPSPSGKLGDHTTNSIGTSMENGIGLLNNNSIIKGQNDGGGGSKTSSPASSPVPLPIFRQNYSQGFGTQSFGRQSHANATTSSVSTSSHSTSTNHQLNNHRVDSTSTTNALLSTLRVIGGASSTGVNAAAVAAYQNALFSAMTAGGHAGGLAGFAGLGTAGLPTLTGTIPTDLSMKNASTSTSSLASSLHLNNSLGSLPQGTSLNHLGTGTLANPFTSSAQSSTASTKPLLLPHKLSNAEIAAVRQLITGYRESAAFLLRSADELESLLMQQP